MERLLKITGMSSTLDNHHRTFRIVFQVSEGHFNFLKEDEDGTRRVPERHFNFLNLFYGMECLSGTL